jgi:dihydroorotate dehydrogenase
MEPDCATRMMAAGASLVQIYAGWIYRGPGFPARVASALAPRQRQWIG